MPDKFITLPQLTKTVKGLINKMNTEVTMADSKIGDLSNLTTSATGNLVAAINEAASSGGSSIDFETDSNVETMLDSFNLDYTTASINLNVPGTGCKEITITNDGIVTQSLDDGKIYHFIGNLTNLTITLNTPWNLSHYRFDFLSGATAPTLNLPNNVIMPDDFLIENNKRYEIDIFNNYGSVMVWTNS